MELGESMDSLWEWNIHKLHKRLAWRNDSANLKANQRKKGSTTQL